LHPHHAGIHGLGKARMFDKSLEWWQKAAKACGNFATGSAKF
jgi:pentatricopeptide repeat protein